MLHGLQRYEFDAVVVDDPEDWHQELPEGTCVQVMLDDGHFHREMDHRVTACGLPIAHVGQWRRAKKYEGNLCSDCYTVRELAEAKKANDAAEAERHTDEPLITRRNRKNGTP
jgi:hypothetical protein